MAHDDAMSMVLKRDAPGRKLKEVGDETFERVRASSRT